MALVYTMIVPTPSNKQVPPQTVPITLQTVTITLSPASHHVQDPRCLNCGVIGHTFHVFQTPRAPGKMPFDWRRRTSFLIIGQISKPL